MLTSLSSIFALPLLLSFIFLLLSPAVLFKGCDAVNLDSHTPALLSTPASSPPDPHPRVPLASDTHIPDLTLLDTSTLVSIPSDFVSPDPSTLLPSTPDPSTLLPSTPDPSTLLPSTPDPSTPDPSTPDPSTPDPSTPDPSTPDPSAPLPSTPDPSTPDPSTPDLSTPDPSTPDPSTPDPSAPLPSTPDPSTPDPSTPLPSTPDPSTLPLSTPDRSTPPPTTPATYKGPSYTGNEGGVSSSKKDLKEKEEGRQVVKQFYLWTRRNSGNSSAQFLDPRQPESISGSLFRPRKTFIIIHGFLGWGTEPWILYLKDKLLRIRHSNVISVDWPAGSVWWLPSYYTAVGKVPGVAKDLTALLLCLVTQWDLDLMDVHLIGHSLGAHVAGLAAAPLRTVGRITGLDPAGLTYHNVSPSQRLDPSDAYYVDVTHTNGCTTLNKWLDCYGINENLGHSDFWPNGGKHQPSCGSRKGMSNGEIGCSHEMAYVYYIESLDYSVDHTFFLARPCGSLEDYNDGVCGCGRETQYMGFSVNVRLNGTYYLSTNSTSPYALQDEACLPGSATGSGVRLIELSLITASALIVIGAFAGAIVMQVAKRRRGRREEGGSVGSDKGGGGGDGGGERSGCVCNSMGDVHGNEVVVDDREFLLP